MDMEGIIEKHLLQTISLGVKENKKITELASRIASDIKSKFKLVAEGEILYDGLGWKVGNKYIVELDIIHNPALYCGKKIRIYVEAIDE